VLSRSFVKRADARPRSNKHIGVVPQSKRLAACGRRRRDPAAVGRPMRIRVGPVVAGGQLPWRCSTRTSDPPNRWASVVVETRQLSLELVVGVRVVGRHVARAGNFAVSTSERCGPTNDQPGGRQGDHERPGTHRVEEIRQPRTAARRSERSRPHGAAGAWSAADFFPGIGAGTFLCARNAIGLCRRGFHLGQVERLRRRRQHQSLRGEPSPAPTRIGAAPAICFDRRVGDHETRSWRPSGRGENPRIAKRIEGK